MTLWQQAPSTSTPAAHQEALLTTHREEHGLAFTPVTLSVKDLWYSVTLKSGESIDLLKGIDAFFRPGTLTALMGSSGAGTSIVAAQCRMQRITDGMML